MVTGHSLYSTRTLLHLRFCMVSWTASCLQNTVMRLKKDQSHGKLPTCTSSVDQRQITYIDMAQATAAPVLMVSAPPSHTSSGQRLQRGRLG